MTTKAKKSTATETTDFVADVTKGFEELTADGRKNLQNAFKSSADAAEDAFIAGTDAFKANYDKAVKANKEQIEKAVSSFKDSPLYDKESSEVFIAAGTTAAEKSEKLGEELLSFGNEYAANFFAMTRSVADAGDAPAAFKIQSDFARSSYEKFAAEVGKLNSLGLEVTKAVTEPMNSRYAVSLDKMMKQTQF